MKISSDIVGASAGPRVQEIDARWLMAYAAALGDTLPEYLDTARPGGILAHPLFPVCYEWPLALDIRARVLTEEIHVRGVHATHDLVVHRPPRAGDRLSTTATVTAVEPRKPGAYVVLRFETVDAQGRPVTTTNYGSLYLGVECDPPPAPPPRPGPEPARAHEAEARPEWSVEVPIPASLAHVYTECARIWNPIHTDRAVALAAGLPDIILHGTASLALAVSQVLRRGPGPGAAARVRRIRCRFGGMVLLPSTLTVEGWDGGEAAPGWVARFRALDPAGRPAVRDGYLLWA
jgi:acyl dehydratase